MFLPRTPSTAATSASLTKPLPVGVARAVFFRDHDGRVGGDPLIKLGDRKGWIVICLLNSSIICLK